jgi:pimeloyl-ACP methyl ester carboxylesterase
MAESRVAVANGRFVADVRDEGEGAPVLYLHGEWGRAPDRAFLSALGAGHRVIAPCHPGYGATTGAGELLDLHDLIYYYLDFLDALGLRDLPLVGQGLGGMLAAELAAVQPERFTRLALLAPLGLWDPADPVLDFFAAEPAALAAALYRDPASPAARAATEVPTDDDRYVAFMLDRAQSLATAAKYLWPIPNRGLNRRLHRVRAPTLLVWGASDGVCSPRYADAFRAAIPHAEAVILPDAGHQLQAERPAEVAALVEGFIG